MFKKSEFQIIINSLGTRSDLLKKQVTRSGDQEILNDLQLTDDLQLKVQREFNRLVRISAINQKNIVTAGIVAAQNGKKIKDCPHPAGSKPHDHWITGFNKVVCKKSECDNEFDDDGVCVDCDCDCGCRGVYKYHLPLLNKVTK